VRELQTGLWHWESRHPDWTPDEPWRPEVSSYAIDDGERLLLFDPLAVPSELEERFADRQPVVVLTAPWHERDARRLVERFGALVFAPPADSQQDLMQKYGITAEQAAGGSPDLAWLRAGSGAEAHWIAAGERLPLGIVAFAGREHNDLVLWVESRRAVVVGDTLADFGRGFEMPVEWLREGVTRESVAEGLRPLLELPVELVLPAHGAPAGRADLERALSPR
jgi:glyoxylase-like metal-dependent hydrolase (beta-lactamase superfamily II)